MRFLKSIIWFLGIVLVSVIALVGVVLATDYVPELQESHEVVVENAAPLGSELTVTTFNIGYCGLDEGQDFFMDGGTGSRSLSEEQTLINLEANIKAIEAFDSDIVMLQEVDVDSTRSYHINQKEVIEAIEGYSHAFTFNYKVPWVPIPLSLPMGKAQSGLMTLVRGDITSAVRYDLPKDQTIPDKYFLLDRCIDELVVPLENGKDLHIINLHLSAYDAAGVIKKEQMQWLRSFILDRDFTNDYYVFGGDWNQLLSDDIVIDRELYNPEWLGEPPTEFDDLNVKWGYDISNNTVRDLYETYHPGQTFETVIDGFLLSSNIEIVDVKTIDLGFINSDHNPVQMKIKID